MLAAVEASQEAHLSDLADTVLGVLVGTDQGHPLAPVGVDASGVASGLPVEPIVLLAPGVVDVDAVVACPSPYVALPLGVGHPLGVDADHHCHLGFLELPAYTQSVTNQIKKQLLEYLFCTS